MSSSALCRRRDRCRLCDGADLELVLGLTPTPPANAFAASPEHAHAQQRFPLDVVFCRRCTHLQLLDVVDPEVLFGDYVYVSGTSPVFVRHFERYAADCIARHRLQPSDLVVEIGSNDGTLLRVFQAAGMRVLGIDPAREIARRATDAGVETWASFFTPALAAQIRAERGPARLVVANNVFAHIDDLAGVTRGVQALLADDGAFVFEVSYAVDVLQKTLFDTIYHEHLDYHAVGPLLPFFAAHGLALTHAERVDTHGGSLRGTAALAGRAVDPSVATLVALERSLGVDRAETWRSFAVDIAAKGAQLRQMLDRLRGSGKQIAGFGAPAKATTLMHHFRIGPQQVAFIIDDSPLKQGLFTPGLGIPVLSGSALAQHKPDALLVLAWNFAEVIMAKHAEFAASGGRFLLPLPTPRLI